MNVMKIMSYSHKNTVKKRYEVDLLLFCFFTLYIQSICIDGYNNPKL